MTGSIFDYVGSITAPPAVASPAQLPSAFFAPGTWQVSGAGDATIGPFKQPFALPPLIKWTNRDSLAAISRTAGATITWDPGGYSPGDIMTVTLFGGGLVSAFCRMPAEAGIVVLTPSLLQQIDPSPTAALRLEISPHPRSFFTVPLAGSGSMRTVFSYLFAESAAVALQ